MGLNLALIPIVIVLAFIVLFIFVVSKNCIHAFIDAIIKKRYDRAKIHHLKLPGSAVVLFLLADFLLFFLDAPEILFKWNNTILTAIVTLIIFFLINVSISLLKIKWEEENKKNIVSLGYVKHFLWVVTLLSSTAVILIIWEISVVDFTLKVSSIIKSNHYLNALSVFVIFLILANTVLYLFKTYLTNMVRQSETPYDNIILSKIEYPVSWIIVFIGVIVSLNQMGLGESVLIPIVKTTIILVIMHTLNVVVENVLDYWERRLKKVSQTKVDESLFVIAHNSSKIVIVIVALIFILLTWGLANELKGVLLSLSVLGVVLGIALRETFSNVISGLSLMLDHTFKSNDLIQLESDEMGIVKKIGLRATKIRTFDNEMLTIPNSTLANSRVLNYTQPDTSHRITIDIGVEYGSDPKKVEKVLLDTLKDKDYVVYPECTEVRFEEMGDFSLDFKLIFFVRDFMESFKIKSDITREIYYQLKKNKIGIPFPTRTIYDGNKGNNTTNKKGNKPKSK